ncbi:hypothetical protein D3C76_871410 [compost metagenome]
MEYDPRSFHSEEFKQIKSEIGILLSRIESLFKYALIGSAAIYAWVLISATGIDGNGVCLKIDKKLLMYTTSLPPMLVFCFGVLAISTYVHIKTMASYLRTIEGVLGYESLGWEKHWAKAPPIITRMLSAFFVILLCAEIGASISINNILAQYSSCVIAKVN